MHIVTIADSGSDRLLNSIKDALKRISLTETERVPVLFFEDIAVDGSDSSQCHSDIESHATSALTKHANICFLAKDPAPTLSTFTSFAKHFVKKDAQGRSQAGLIVVSAHPSLKKPSSSPTKDTFLRTLIDTNIIDPQRIILVGVRAWTQEESAFIRSNRIRCFTMRNLQEEGFNEICLSIMEHIRQWPSAYLSINIDAVDPAFAPATSFPEPGGLSSRELIHLIHKLSLLKNIQARDLVGIDQSKDVNDQTINLGARILAEWA